MGVGTVMDAKEVLVLITGANKAFALYKVAIHIYILSLRFSTCQAIEEGVCHMWTVSAFQQHPNTMIIVDEVEIYLHTIHFERMFWFFFL